MLPEYLPQTRCRSGLASALRACKPFGRSVAKPKPPLTPHWTGRKSTLPSSRPSASPASPIASHARDEQRNVAASTVRQWQDRLPLWLTGACAALAVIVNSHLQPAAAKALLGVELGISSAFTEEEILREALGVVQNLFIDARVQKPDWDQILQAGLADVEHKVGAVGSIQHCLDKLGDPFTRIVTLHDTPQFKMDTTGQVVHVGLRVQPERDGSLRVAYVAAGSSAERHGIRVGDLILAINDMPTVSLTKARWDDKGASGQCKDLQLHLAAEPINVSPVTHSIMPRLEATGTAAGYIRVRSFGHTTAGEVLEAITALQAQGASGFVLDLRGNAGGLVQAGYDIAQILLNEGEVFCYITNLVGPEHQAAIHATQALATEPLVILVNDGTASTSEILSAALQGQHRALLVGEHTFGKGRTQRIIPLRDGSTLLVSNALLTSPTHQRIDKVGLQPDVLCKADPEGFRAWLADDSRPSNLMKDGCLSMAVQQLQLNDRSSASLSGANAPVDQSQPMTDDKGALWRAHVASVQAH